MFPLKQGGQKENPLPLLDHEKGFQPRGEGKASDPSKPRGGKDHGPEIAGGGEHGVRSLQPSPPVVGGFIGEFCWFGVGSLKVKRKKNKRRGLLTAKHTILPLLQSLHCNNGGRLFLL